MLREDLFLTFKISSINWSIFEAHEDIDQHWEISMQIFYGDARPLSNKAMVPLRRDRSKAAWEPLSWMFLQLPMQCLITSDLSLVIEVHKVVMKYGDVEPVRCFNVTRSCSPIRTLEGWSTINLGATYALSNVMDG